MSLSIQEINRIYNAFPPEGRDINREDFVKEMRRLTSPTEAQKDLKRIMDGKRRKARIDRAIRNG